MPSKRIVACPHCGKNVEWAPENRYRPFCSERCKLIDLGAWASEQYRVPVVEDKDDVEAGEAGLLPPSTARQEEVSAKRPSSGQRRAPRNPTRRPGRRP